MKQTALDINKKNLAIETVFNWNGLLLKSVNFMLIELLKEGLPEVVEEVLITMSLGLNDWPRSSNVSKILSAVLEE